MRVKVFICPKCQAGVFSRALKDFRTCSCSAMGITGGPEEPHISAGSSLAPKIKIVELNLKASADTLEGDWSSMTDEFGFVPKGDSRIKSSRAIKADELGKYLGTKEETKPERSGDEDEEGEGEEAEEAAAEES
ncbi:MAG: hypothetical protein HY075_06265 [Deltaproteobacteria bacterium]|nr:hypothetical protein [Deltaproteobacteria bacterium]